MLTAGCVEAARHEVTLQQAQQQRVLGLSEFAHVQPVALACDAFALKADAFQQANGSRVVGIGIGFDAHPAQAVEGMPQGEIDGLCGQPLAPVIWLQGIADPGAGVGGHDVVKGQTANGLIGLQIGNRPLLQAAITPATRNAIQIALRLSDFSPSVMTPIAGDAGVAEQGEQCVAIRTRKAAQDNAFALQARGNGGFQTGSFAAMRRSYDDAGASALHESDFETIRHTARLFSPSGSFVMAILRLADLDLAGKRVLIREDLNVPVKDGKVTSEQRITAALPTLRLALEKGAAVMVTSHLGRPTEGQWSEADSLAPVAARLAHHLGREVRLIRDWVDGGFDVAAGELVLLENCRMNVGEGKDSAELSAKYAALCDIYCMDAFGTAHRAQASTHGAIRAAKVACGGPLLMAELDALAKALLNPARPLLAIVAGSKVSTKLELLGSLVSKVDQLIVGGGIANTFLAAQGYSVGKSLCEFDLLDTARQIIADAKARGAEIPLPSDVVVALAFAADAPATIKAIADVGAEDMILDIGPATAARYAELIAKAGSVVWNGPVGVFEFDAFGKGTEALAKAIAASSAFSIAGGGDTLAAVDKYGVEAGISYISTGGGAFLEFCEGKVLPAVAALEARG